MNEDLLKIINHYKIMPQLKYFQSEVFELNEAIITAPYTIAISAENYKHVVEEMADVLVMLKQFQLWYEITDEEIEEVMKYKINRQLERIKESE